MVFRFLQHVFTTVRVDDCAPNNCVFHWFHKLINYIMDRTCISGILSISIGEILSVKLFVCFLNCFLFYGNDSVITALLHFLYFLLEIYKMSDA